MIINIKYAYDLMRIKTHFYFKVQELNTIITMKAKVIEKNYRLNI